MDASCCPPQLSSKPLFGRVALMLTALRAHWFSSHQMGTGGHGAAERFKKTDTKDPIPDGWKLATREQAVAHKPEVVFNCDVSEQGNCILHCAVHDAFSGDSTQEGAMGVDNAVIDATTQTSM